jgi:hypothetical protein
VLAQGGWDRARKAGQRIFWHKEEPRLAALVLSALVLLLSLQNAICLESDTRVAPRLSAFHVSVQLITIAAYLCVISLDPGFVPGGTERDRKLYWAAAEAASSAPMEGSDGNPCAVSGFCDRSELRRSTRAKYSPYARGMVEVMDHDCIYLGVCVGRGNQRAFVIFLAAAASAIATGVSFAIRVPPSAIVGLTAVGRRLYAFGVLLGLVLLFPLSYLLYGQLRGILSNTTLVEEMRWMREHPGVALPSSRADADWQSFAPHDRGSAPRNVIAFVLARRSGPHSSSSAPSRPMKKQA